MIAKRFEKPTEAAKDSILGALLHALEKHPEVVFGYLHGSFGRGEAFNDIDIAVYVSDVPAAPLDYELELETELQTAAADHPVDVRLLNAAPLSFRYQVIKEGTLLIARDDERRSGFHEATLADYFEFAPYRARYLKETLGIGI
jgi:uncharacterized protein